VNVDPERLITWLIFISGIMGVWYRNEYRVTRLDEKYADLKEWLEEALSEHKRQVAAIWKWKEDHEKDASNMRLELQKQIGKVESGISLHDNQYQQILNQIESMNTSLIEKIEELKNSIKEIRK
jgi:hypothetical protein